MNDIEFIEDGHIYLINGVICPSVSQLVAFYLKEDFSMIPQHILENASRFGTEVHDDIEKHLKGEFVNNEIVFAWTRDIGERIKYISSEQIISTDDYVGRYDLIAYVDGQEALVDIKTNSKYPKEHLEVQLGLYLNALNKGFKTYCAWFDKKKIKWELKEVEAISKEKCKEIVKLYEVNSAR